MDRENIARDLALGCRALFQSPWQSCTERAADYKCLVCRAAAALAAETTRADREAAARQEAERERYVLALALQKRDTGLNTAEAERDRLRAELEGVAADLEHSRERDSVTEEAVAELRAEIAALRAGAA